MTSLRSRASAWLVLAAGLLACGGSNPEAASANKAKGGDGNDRGAGPGVAEAMAAQGGSTALASAAAGAGASLAGSLKAELLPKDSKVKLDGVPLEWPQRTGASTTIKGSPKTKFATAIQYDADKLYVAGEITDKGFVEGRSFVTLFLAFPSGTGTFSGYEVGLYPGKAGESAGSVKLKGSAIAGAKIIEAPTDSGLTFEAVIPWSTFPESARMRVGLRGALRYSDATGAVIATGEGDASDPKRLPALPTEPEQGLIDNLLAAKGLLNESPKFELYADVAGDAMKERVSVFGTFFTICGAGYREGKEFFYRDLGNAELLSLEARELTGRGKADVVVRRRYPTKAGAREHFEVWSVLSNAEPTTTFTHEILVTDGQRRVSNTVHAAAKSIEVSTASASGWDVNSFREPQTTDAEPILLPWGPIKSRTYRFDGSKFARAGEVAQKPETPSTPAGAAPGPAIARVEPPTPPQKKGGDLAQQMLEQFKKDRGMAADAKPKSDVTVHVAEDARPERVVLIGRDIVVFGPGFKSGSSYAYITLTQFESDADVREMNTRDLNGDGAADLIVRGVRRVAAQGATAPVELEALFVYVVANGNVTRVFAIEAARESGNKRVQGLVQFVPSKGGKGFDVDVRPGRATGWTDKTYPWGQEQPGTGALEPLLLPWGGIPSLRYAWDGSKFSVQR